MSDQSKNLSCAERFVSWFDFFKWSISNLNRLSNFEWLESLLPAGYKMDSQMCIFLVHKNTRCMHFTHVFEHIFLEKECMKVQIISAHRQVLHVGNKYIFDIISHFMWNY